MYEFLNISIFNFFTVGQLLLFVVSILVTFLLFGKKGLCSFLLSIIKGGIKKMIEYRTEKTLKTSKGQTFERFKPVYRLNKSTNELEKTDEVIDIQEIVNSQLSTCLDAILDKFLPFSDVSEEIVELDNFNDNLDKMQEASMIAESYRQKYGLSETLTQGEIFKEVQNRKLNLEKSIKEVQSKNEALSEFRKEVLENEEKTDKESK